VKMRRCEDEQMWRWEDVKMSRCEDEKMWRWADVKMRRCEDVKISRCEDVRMRRCENWRCDVKMWRCENVWQTPTIRSTLRSDALGKKTKKGTLPGRVGRSARALAARLLWQRELWHQSFVCLWHWPKERLVSRQFWEAHREDIFWWENGKCRAMDSK